MTQSEPPAAHDIGGCLDGRGAAPPARKHVALSWSFGTLVCHGPSWDLHHQEQTSCRENSRYLVVAEYSVATAAVKFSRRPCEGSPGARGTWRRLHTLGF